MAGEEAAAGARRRAPFCNSALCRVLSSLGFIGSGFYVFYAARDSMARRGLKPPLNATKIQLALSIGLISWGLTILMFPPRRWEE